MILRDDAFHTTDFIFFRGFNVCSVVIVCPTYTCWLEMLIPPTELGVLLWGFVNVKCRSVARKIFKNN